MLSYARGPMSAPALERIWQVILETSVTRSGRCAREPVAYRGGARRVQRGGRARFAAPGEALMPMRQLRKLFDAVEQPTRRDAARRASRNTLAGPVLACWDPLTTRNVRVTAETIVAVSHALVGVPGRDARGVRRVLSHPVALQQCERFFLANPRIEAVPVFDTAGAVRR